jgi:hypothetical protein
MLTQDWINQVKMILIIYLSILFLLPCLSIAGQPPNEQVITIGVKTPRPQGTTLASGVQTLPDNVSLVTFRLERPTDPAITYEGRFEWSLDDFVTFRTCGTKDKGGIVTELDGTIIPWTTCMCPIPPGVNRKVRAFYSVTGSVHNTAIEIVLK